MNRQSYHSLPHPTSFAGRTKLLEYYNGTTSAKNIEKQLQSSNTYTQMRQAKRPRIYNPSYTSTYGDHIEIDLFQINTLKQFNRGISFYLICIDAFSRYAWARPLKKKTALACQRAFKSIIDEMPFKVTRIVCDDGAEFKGAFKEYLDEEDIEKTLARKHAAYVERLIGTLKGILSKAMKERESVRHYDIFDDVIASYNNRIHRIIQMRPSQAIDPENADRIRYEHAMHWQKREAKFRSREPKFQVGDLVRPQKKRHTWARSFHQVFETQIFRIKEVFNHMPIVMYGIETLDGDRVRQRKYASELQKVENLDNLRIEKIFRNKKRTHPDTGELTVLVKYAELPSSYNDYVPVNSLPNRKRKGRQWN